MDRYPSPGGQRIRRSAGTTSRPAAQEYHDKLKNELWRVLNLGDKPKHIFEEACILLLKASERQRNYATKVRHVKYWRAIFAGRPVCSLTNAEILAGLPTHRIYEDKRKSKKLKPTTRNRYLSTIHQILSIAADANWITKVPKLSKFEKPSERMRWEPQPVITKLIDAMTLAWMRDVSLFAVATSMRETEILSLHPSRIDMARCNASVTADCAKSGYARSVPLNDDTTGVLGRRSCRVQKKTHQSCFAMAGGGMLRVPTNIGTLMSERVNCTNCGALLPVEWIRPPSKSNACPECGSSKRTIHVAFVEEVRLDIKESLDVKSRNRTLPSKKNPRVHLVTGDEVRKSDGRWVKKDRLIDKDQNRYREFIVDPDTGEVIRDVDEPLSDHYGHGSAKCKITDPKR